MHNFRRKIFLLLYSTTWPNFIVWLPLLREILHNMCDVTVYLPGCDVINFEINLVFLIKLFFLMAKMSTQDLNVLRMRRAFTMKKNAFFIIFKWLSLKQTKQFLLEDESPTLKTFNNYPIIMTNNCDIIRILWMCCFCLCCLFLS